MKPWMVRLSSIVLVGCGVTILVWLSSATVAPARSEPTPPVEFKAQAQPQTPTPPNSATEAFVPGVPNPDGYSYDPTGKRDPFTPWSEPKPIDLKKIEVEVAVPQGPPEPLEVFDLTQLKVIGIIWNVNEPKAMVKDPLGRLHLVRKDTKMGRNRGFVGKIREGEVIVVEPTQSADGTQTVTMRVLELTR